MSRRQENHVNMIKKIHEEYISLYERKGLDGITIKELCEKIGIVKSTFYTYYDDKYSILDDISNELLGSLDNIIKDLKDVDIAIVDQGLPLVKASKVVEYIKEHRSEFKALLGPYGDPRFEIKWKNDIEKSFTPKFKKEKGDSRNAEIACVIFSSSLIGLFKYFIFKNPKLTNNELSIMLGNTLKYSLFEFQVGV